MSRWRPRTALVLCLLGSICLGLALLIYQELTDPPTPASHVALAEPAAVEPLPPEAVLSLPALELFSALVERPVFSPTRRPEEEEAEESEPTQEPVSKPPNFSLAGIVISEKGRFVVAVQQGRKGGVVRVGEGRSIDGWKVARIEPDRAVFQRGETENLMVLEFYRQSDGAPNRPREAARGAGSRR